MSELNLELTNTRAPRDPLGALSRAVNPKRNPQRWLLAVGIIGVLLVYCNQDGTADASSNPSPKDTPNAATQAKLVSTLKPAKNLFDLTACGDALRTISNSIRPESRVALMSSMLDLRDTPFLSSDQRPGGTVIKLIISNLELSLTPRGVQNLAAAVIAGRYAEMPLKNFISTALSGELDQGGLDTAATAITEALNNGERFIAQTGQEGAFSRACAMIPDVLRHLLTKPGVNAAGNTAILNELLGLGNSMTRLLEGE